MTDSTQPARPQPAGNQAIGLPDAALTAIRQVLARHPEVEAAILYGSRALGRHRPASDIDLTLVAPGLSHQGRLRLMGALDDLLLPWSIDLSLRHELPESLAQHVARVGRRLVPG